MPEWDESGFDCRTCGMLTHHIPSQRCEQCRTEFGDGWPPLTKADAMAGVRVVIYDDEYNVIHRGRLLYVKEMGGRAGVLTDSGSHIERPVEKIRKVV